MTPEPDDLSPALGGAGADGGLAPELGSTGSKPRPWWRSLKGPIAVLLAGLESKTPTERRRAAEALARLGDRRAIPALSERVREDARWEVRKACVEALLALGGEVQPGLHRALRDGHPAVRIAAAEGLAVHGSRASLQPMDDLLAYLQRFASASDVARVAAAIATLRSRLGEGPPDC